MPLVQHASSTGNGSPLAASFSSNTTAGNCVIVVAYYVDSGSRDLSGVTLGGSADNFASLAFVVNPAGGAGSGGVSIWADPNCAGGQKVISATQAGMQIQALDIYEFSGVVHSSILDKSSTNTGIGVTSWSSGSTATTTQAIEILIGAATVYSNGGTVTGPSSPWNNEPLLTGGDLGGTWTGISGYQSVSSTQTATYSGTNGTSNNYAAVVVTLKAGVSVSLSPFAVTIGFSPILGLIAAMAPVAGTDPVGNAFTAGFTGPVTAFKPATSPTVVETWHNATPPAGWTGTLRYKVLAQTNMAVIDFDLTNAGAASPLSLLTLPGTYSPAGNVYRPCIAFTTANVACQAEIASSGAVTVTWASGNATRIGGTLYYPLD